MKLAGRLSNTTLGDVLGTLGRGEASGMVTLTERRGPTAGRQHQIHLERGRMIAIDTTLGSPRWGTAQAGDGIDAKLDALFQLEDANVTFHVIRPAPYAPVEPVAVTDAVRGRPRTRDKAAVGGEGYADAARAAGSGAADARRGRGESKRRAALRTLGLDEGADQASIQRAFRELAAHAHPDRGACRDELERKRLERRFASLSSAYHALVG